jgi:urease accessory protein
MKATRVSHSAGTFLFSLLMAAPAFAHHPTGGELPTSFYHGLLSGLGHPILGLDHLAAIVGVGILAALIGAGPKTVFAFVLAMLAGVAIHLASFDLPYGELLVALSTAVIGILIATRLSLGTIPTALLFAAAGIVHGYALGESIIGAEPTPLYAYLAGLAVVQSAIALAAYYLTMTVRDRSVQLAPKAVMAAGAVIALVGAYFTAGATGFVA